MNHGDKTKLRILDKANELFYHQGFNATSISHIVDATGMSKGNITYHFKSKQEILEGIIAKRLADINALLRTWDLDFSSPVDRLLRFCEMLLDEQKDLALYGCPMGTLTGEFSKNQPDLYQVVLPMFKRFKQWLMKQFSLLNFSTEDAKEHSLEILARVQGIAVITHAFKDTDFLMREIHKLKDEIQDRYGNYVTSKTD